jgi:hypothetical protein
LKHAAAAGLVFAGLIAACTAMNGLKVIPSEDSTDPGTSSSSGKPKKDASASSSSGVPGACNHAKEPAKPAADPGGTDTTLTFAMRQLVPNNEGTPFGLDLDGLCTCFTEVGAKAPGPDACKRTTSACDDPQDTGLDNAGAVLFKQIANQGGVNFIDVENGHVAGGQIGLLIHIEGYNGLANDDAISVRFIRSAGISGGPNPSQKDAWPDSSDSFPSTEAYVANKVLVARFDEVEVPFVISTPQPAKMKGAIVTGALADGNALPELVVAGRSNTGELVASVGQLEVTGIGPLCQTMPFDDRYRTFGGEACKVSDMPTDPAKTGDLNTPCDAMSFGVKMLMIPANLGSKASLSVGGDRCGGVDGYPVPCPNP